MTHQGIFFFSWNLLTIASNIILHQQKCVLFCFVFLRVCWPTNTITNSKHNEYFLDFFWNSYHFNSNPNPGIPDLFTTLDSHWIVQLSPFMETVDLIHVIITLILTLIKLVGLKLTYFSFSNDPFQLLKITHLFSSCKQTMTNELTRQLVHSIQQRLHYLCQLPKPN